MEKAMYYFQTISTEKIEAPSPALKQMSEDEFQGLKKSIQDVGILSPIHVYFNEDRNKYIILEGRHRFRAALELGFKEVPCIVETNTYPGILISHIYETELFRKSYMHEDREKFLKEEQQQKQIAIERTIAHLASKGLPEDVLRRIVNSGSVNNLKRMEKLLTYIDRYHREIIEKLKQEKLSLEEQLAAEKDKEKALREEINSYKKAIEMARKEFEERLQKKVEERMAEEKEKLKALSEEPSAEKLKALEEQIRQEIREALEKEFKEKEKTLEQDLLDAEKKTEGTIG